MNGEINEAKAALRERFEFVNGLIQNYLPNKLGTALSREEIQIIKQQYESLNNNTSGIYGVIDFTSQKYIFVSDNVSYLDTDKQSLMENGPGYIVSLFHPDEREIVLREIFPTVIRFLGQSQNDARLKDARAMFTTRVRIKNGEYRWFIHQMSIIDADKDNRPLLALKYMMELEGIRNSENIWLVLSLRDENNIYHPVSETSFPLSPQEPLLSRREREVLDLIAAGKTSKEIANVLSLSEHTVNNHRKNMLRKADVSSISELIFNVTAGRVR
jgi:DNA-binding CsgD family transcriptional regulator